MALRISNKTVVKQDGYQVKVNRIKFWELSYQCYGPVYSRGVDGEGVKIIRKHEREETEDYARRVETAVPISMVGPILRRFNDFVFRKPAVFDEQFDEFYKDVDGQGTDSDEFMKDAVLKAQINGADFILVDSNVMGDEQKSVAQAQADGDRVVWKHIRAMQIVQWRMFNGQLVEVAFIQEDKHGQEFVVWMDDTMMQRVNIKTNEHSFALTVLDEPDEPIPHGFDQLPLIPIKPDFGEQLSQAASLSEMQKSVARLRSLLDEEIVNNTFTQMYVTGESAENVQSLTTGTKSAVFFPNPATTVNFSGADPAQADSIRRSIDSDIMELHRTAGISADAGDGPVESGVAKAFKFNDLAAILASISKAAQQAQRKAEALTAFALGITDYVPVKYPDEFLMPIYKEELTDIILLIQSGLPNVLKSKALTRFADRNLELTDVEKLQLEQQSEDLGSLPGLLT